MNDIFRQIAKENGTTEKAVKEEIFYTEKKKARRLRRTSVFYGSICFDCFTSVSITS